MPEVVFSVDQSKSMRDQDVPGHNRWHPDIPNVAMVKPGAEFRMECRDWTDCQIGNNDTADDVRDIDLTIPSHAQRPDRRGGRRTRRPARRRHPRPRPRAAADRGCGGPELGYTGIFAKANGGGFLTDYYPDAYKAIWDFHGQQATSRHLPGIRFTGITHPGLFGTAPSSEMLARWNTREKALIDADPNRVPPLALPPEGTNALAGTATGDLAARIAAEGARTVPARENGGNQDIKNFTRGSRVFFPVHVKDAKLSGGDLHFSQGDGEITFCGAIEMGGFIDFHVDLIKGGMEKYGISTNPVFIPGNVEPRYTEFLTFIGISVDHDTGTNYYLDATLAYRRACLNAVEYFKRFGYSGEQAYLLLGSAPVEGRISGIVDVPNACCSLYVPTAMFDFEIRPSAAGPATADRGQCALTTI